MTGLLGRLAPRARLERLDDEALVARAGGGDNRAFAELYRRHVDAVFAYVRYRVRDEELAEDLCQDVFLNAFKAMPGFRWQGKLRPWLLRVAHNRVANHWRTIGRRPRSASLKAEEGEEDPLLQLIDEAHFLDEVEIRFATDEVMAAMAALSELQAQAIVLRFVLELSVAETASVMGRGVSAVKSLQFSGLVKLRAALAQPDAETAASRDVVDGNEDDGTEMVEAARMPAPARERAMESEGDEAT